MKTNSLRIVFLFNLWSVVTVSYFSDYVLVLLCIYCLVDLCIIYSIIFRFSSSQNFLCFSSLCLSMVSNWTNTNVFRIKHLKFFIIWVKMYLLKIFHVHFGIKIQKKKPKNIFLINYLYVILLTFFVEIYIFIISSTNPHYICIQCWLTNHYDILDKFRSN